MLARQVDWDEYRAAEDREHDEHVPDHAEEAEKDDGIEADLLNEVLLFDILDRPDPTEWLAVQGYRGMLLVCMFGSTGVHGRAVGAEPAKDEEEAARDGERVYYRSVDGVGLDLLVLVSGSV